MQQTVAQLSSLYGLRDALKGGYHVEPLDPRQVNEYGALMVSTGTKRWKVAADGSITKDYVLPVRPL